MEIAGSAAARGDGKFTGEVRLGTCCEGSGLLVPDVDPFDLALAAKRVGQPVQAVANDAINPLDASCGEQVRKLVRYSPCPNSIFRCTRVPSAIGSEGCRGGLQQGEVPALTSGTPMRIMRAQTKHYRLCLPRGRSYRECASANRSSSLVQLVTHLEEQKAGRYVPA
jgi:hypothetical protein